MVVLVLVFLAFLTCAPGQSISDLPNCSLSCFQAATSRTTCGKVDLSCQCQPANYNIIKSFVTPCLTQSTCSIADLHKIQDLSNTFCPDVLASASASGASATSAVTETIPSLQTASIVVSVANATTVAFSTASPSADSSATSFGADTPGTNWKPVQDPESTANRGPTFEAMSIILLCVTAMILAFRFFARWYTKTLRNTVQSVGWDDWLAALALIGTAGITTTIVLGTQRGMGKHLGATTSLRNLEDILKIMYAFVLILIVVLGALKVSILSLYVRMTPTSYHKRICYVVMALVIAHDIAALFGSILSCVPISEFWNLSSHTIFENPACINYLPFEIFNSVWSAVEDVIIWMLPVPVVWSLKVSAQRKMGLYFLIGVSLISVICAIARLTVTIIWIRSIDVSWNYPLIPFLSNTEACIAIITSSVPAIQPLFRGSLKQQRLEHSTSHYNRSPSARRWIGLDSTTAVPVTTNEQDQRTNESWTLSTRLRMASTRLKAIRPTTQRRLPQFNMQTGTMTEDPRTELKDMELDDDVELVPGIAVEKALRMK